MTADDDTSEVSEGAVATDARPAIDASTETGAPAEPGSPESSSPPEPEPEDLLGQLSRAMHTAADSQHQRIVDDLARQRAAQVAAIEARAGAEAETLKQTSELDIREIDQWAKSATEMIAAERSRRIDARRERLQAELRRHDVIVEREVMAVEVAIEDHRAELEVFFKRLEGESDPAAIASVASSLPVLPSLADAAEAARRHAAAEFAPIDELDAGAAGAEPDGIAIDVSPARLMAVMDPDAAKGNAGETVPPWPEPRAIAVPAGVGASATDEDTARTADDTAKPAEAPANNDGRPLLRAVPSSRPMDRLLGWNRKANDDPGREP